MCNVCGCREAEDESPKKKKKYRTPTKKQRQMEDEAMMDVDYMRDSYQTEFEAMERFPSGDHDVNMCIAVLQERYPGIEINEYTYLTEKTGSSNKYHVFIETSEGNFNLYGRIGYGNPKVYGPMGYGQYHKKMNLKIRKGYRKEEMDAETFAAEEDDGTSSFEGIGTCKKCKTPSQLLVETRRGAWDGDFCYPCYDELYGTVYGEKEVASWMTPEQAARLAAEEDQDHDYTPESYDPLSENPENYDPMSESYSAHDCGCGVSSCRDCESACGCTCKCAEEFLERYEAPRKGSGRKRRYGKRQRFGNRYLARRSDGRWISNVGVSGSIRQDLRRDAKTQQPPGFRGLGDAKVHHAEDGMLTNAIVQWEDGFGTSSPSSPPRDIMWAEEEYTEDYPQNSAQIDGVTGAGVPVSYGSGSSQYVEPPVRMGAETFSASIDVRAGRKAADIFLPAEIKKLKEISAEIDAALAAGDFDKADKLSEQFKQFDAEGMTYTHEDYIPNSYGEDSALTSGRGVPVWYGSAEHQRPDGSYDFVEAVDFDIPDFECPHCGKTCDVIEYYSHRGSMSPSERVMETEILYGCDCRKDPSYPTGIAAWDERLIKVGGVWQKKEAEEHQRPDGSYDFVEAVDFDIPDFECPHCGKNCDVIEYWEKETAGPQKEGVMETEILYGCDCEKKLDRSPKYEWKKEDFEVFRNRAETFEAPMQRFPPGKNDVDTAKAKLRSRFPGIRFSGSPVYLVDRRGSANKFHVFLDSNKGGFNVYGRIGYPKPQVFGPMGEGKYMDKMRSKITKGYKKTKFSAEANFPGLPGAVDDGYYPNSWGEDSASISGQGVPQWYGSAEGTFDAEQMCGVFNDQPHQWGEDWELQWDNKEVSVTCETCGAEGTFQFQFASCAECMGRGQGCNYCGGGGTHTAEEFELAKPIETGAKVGFGFILASVGSVVAATALGMLLGD